MGISKGGLNGIKHTIVEVAKHAGVGVSTVSRVINNKSDVSDETRNKVLQSMSSLNYVPNRAARALGKGIDDVIGKNNTLNVGLVVQEDLQQHPYFIHILRGVESQLSLSGYSCIFSQIKNADPVKSSTDSNLQLPNILIDPNVEGIISVGLDSEYIAEVIKGNGLPSVFIDSSDFGSEFNYIKADNIQGAKAAVSYLLKLGHKKIAFVRSEVRGWFFDELEYGYISALRASGIQYDPQLSYNGEDSFESGYSIAKQIVNAVDRPTAIFTNDITAIGVMKAVKESGLRIPEDISIMGFDDIDIAGYFEPSLTSVKVLKTEIGEMAARKLVQMMKGDGNLMREKVLVPTSLVIRNSTGEVT